MGDDWKNLNKNDSQKKHGYSIKRWLVSASFLLFIFNIWKFINTPGSEIPSFIFIIQYDIIFGNNNIYYSQE